MSWRVFVGAWVIVTAAACGTGPEPDDRDLRAASEFWTQMYDYECAPRDTAFCRLADECRAPATRQKQNACISHYYDHRAVSEDAADETGLAEEFDEDGGYGDPKDTAPDAEEPESQM